MDRTTTPSLYDTSTSTVETSPSRGKTLFPRSHPHHHPARNYGSHTLVAAAKAASSAQQHSKMAASWTSAPVVTQQQQQPHAPSYPSHHRMTTHGQPRDTHAERPVVAYPDHSDRRHHQGSAHHHHRRRRDTSQDDDGDDDYETNHHTAQVSSRYTQSEPGAYPYYARVAAVTTKRQQQAAEEKKEDHERNATTTTTTKLYSYPDPEPDLDLDPSDRGANHDLPAFWDDRGRTDTKQSPSRRSHSKTRELARRFEQQQSSPPLSPQRHGTTTVGGGPSLLYGKAVVERRSNRAVPKESTSKESTAESSLTLVPERINNNNKESLPEGHATLVERAEIETPEPARVKALKQKLWGPNDCLQVAVKPNWSPDLAKHHHHHQQYDFYHHHHHHEDGGMEKVEPPRDHAIDRQHFVVSQEATARAERMNETEVGTTTREDGDMSHLRETSGKGHHPAMTEARTSTPATSRHMTQIQRETRPLGGNNVDESKSRGLANRQAIVRRNARSLSPKPRRSQYPSSVESSNESRGKGDNSKGGDSKEENSNKLLFKSKFYEAAQRGLSNSPARSSSTAAVRSNASSYQRKQRETRAAVSDVGADRAAMAALVARLSSVDRSDPSAALARIDAILHGDSPASPPQADAVGVKQLEAVADTGNGGEQDDDESSSGDSSVSSITNPTFHAHAASNKGVTTSSGKPRPTTLGAYGSSKSKPVTKEKEKEVKHPKRSSTKKTRKSKDRGPPPGTIRLSNKDKNKIEKAASPDRSKASCCSPVPEMPLEADCVRIDPSNSSELAEKIRRWDELSSPDAVRSNDLESVPEAGEGDPTDEEKKATSPFRSTAIDSMPASPNSLVARNRKHHPWDSSIPVRMGKVNTRDTSMDSALGIEAEFTPKYGADESSIDGPRQLQKERLVRELRGGLGTKHNDEDNVPSEYRDLAGALDGDSFSVDPKLLPAEKSDRAQGPSPLQRESAEALAEDFDSAWVNLPTSTFFPDSAEESQQRSSRSSHPSKRVVDPSEKLVSPRAVRQHDDIQMFAPRTEHGHRQKRSFQPPEKTGQHHLSAYDQGQVGVSSSGEDPSAEVGGVEVALTRQGRPSRRGIRGLLRRRANVARDTVVLEQSSSMSTSYDAHTNTSMDEADLAERGRRRRTSPGPKRGRARSLDERRVRNPSIARKFSRLLRVYDNENDERGHI